jgi:hypothetical protein
VVSPFRCSERNARWFWAACSTWASDYGSWTASGPRGENLRSPPPPPGLFSPVSSFLAGT